MKITARHHNTRTGVTWLLRPVSLAEQALDNPCFCGAPATHALLSYTRGNPKLRLDSPLLERPLTVFNPTDWRCDRHAQDLAGAWNEGARTP